MARVPLWLQKRLPLEEFLERHITGYPAPRNLNYLWSFGALALLFLAVQIVTGIWLAMFYKPAAALAFDSVQHIMREVNWGWLIRYLHAVGASGFFLVVYVHVGRGIYYGSYKDPRELLWWIGIALFFVLMAQAFTGYLLPWGNMSYWSATVITSLFGVVPVVGETIVTWLRGDFGVGDATLTRFFAFHVALFPVAVLGGLVLLHLAALHRVGSSNPEGADLDKHGPDVIPFSPFFVAKDLWFAGLALIAYFAVVFFLPTYAMEPLNWEPPNLLATPGHIVPEWYFLPFYAVLRSIPSRLGGAAAMQAAILILALLPFLDRSPVRSCRHRPVKRVLTVLLFADFALLAWAGAQPPVSAGVLLAERLATAYYFLYFLALPLLPRIEKASPAPERGNE
jgi:ubiquinol-cytochrome c reductase cytochrome b subunit